MAIYSAFSLALFTFSTLAYSCSSIFFVLTIWPHESFMKKAWIVLSESIDYWLARNYLWLVILLFMGAA